MICIPLKFRQPSSLLANFRLAQKQADFVEIWFDELSTLNPNLFEQIAKHKRCPILYKSSGQRLLLEKVLSNCPIEYLDLDLKAAKKLCLLAKKISPSTKLILSYHNFQKTPALRTLRSLARQMQNKNADILKFACTANSLNDSLVMLGFLEELKQQGIKAICLCMGSHGKITRLAGHIFGNYLMYAPLKLSAKTAPGQIRADELKKVQSLLSELCH